MSITQLVSKLVLLAPILATCASYTRVTYTSAFCPYTRAKSAAGAAGAAVVTIKRRHNPPLPSLLQSHGLLSHQLEAGQGKKRRHCCPLKTFQSL